MPAPSGRGILTSPKYATVQNNTFAPADCAAAFWDIFPATPVESAVPTTALVFHNSLDNRFRQLGDWDLGRFRRRHGVIL